MSQNVMKEEEIQQLIFAGLSYEEIRYISWINNYEDNSKKGRIGGKKTIKEPEKEEIKESEKKKGIIEDPVESIRKVFQDTEIDTDKSYARFIYNGLVDIPFQRGSGKKSKTQDDSYKHERSVIDYFKKLGFFESLKKNEEDIWYYNDRVISVTDINNAIKNYKKSCQNKLKLSDGKYVIWQIRGTQNHPDCILLHVIGNMIKIFPIECKLCSGIIKWNDSIPKEKYYFYHIINSNTKRKCIFPSGHSTIIHPVVLHTYDMYVKEVKELNNKYKTKFKDLETTEDKDGNLINPQGFGAYPRKNFTQKKKKDLKYDYTEYPEEIKSQWKKEFVERFAEFLSK
jgi:hypothetical protein